MEKCGMNYGKELEIIIMRRYTSPAPPQGEEKAKLSKTKR